ncbi:hypothetical protein UAJ10_02190 [Nitrospirillum sp. BR 11164]|uniref:hypothetical protein n=1 Tax=Nitrospirillum sp. BR 11164 TaxID=3104324 RepID=UPI002AFFA26C|nr:hypothetical protein [Nitrospirillum sp. BR 11164]MEA1647829.1 hypothetical protein [Nitrospirillum sp. BR 11164]
MIYEGAPAGVVAAGNRAGATVVDIRSIDGTILHVAADAISIVTGPYDGDPPSRSYVTGPRSTDIATDEDVDALLARVHPARALLQFTRLDGRPIWLKGAVISIVTTRSPDADTGAVPAGALVHVGSRDQDVQESVNDVLTALANQGINF